MLRPLSPPTQQHYLILQFLGDLWRRFLTRIFILFVNFYDHYIPFTKLPEQNMEKIILSAYFLWHKNKISFIQNYVGVRVWRNFHSIMKNIFFKVWFPHSSTCQSIIGWISFLQTFNGINDSFALNSEVSRVNGIPQLLSVRLWVN